MKYSKKLKLLYGAVANNDATTIEQLMPVEEMDAHALVEKVVVLGHHECVKVLAQYTSAETLADTLVDAAKQGQDTCVTELLQYTQGTYRESLALCFAANYGHTKCIELLIPVSNPKDRDSLALRWAAEEGHIECVRLLLPVSDVKAEDSDALQRACINKHENIIDLLYDFSDPKSALESMVEYGCMQDDINLLRQRIAQQCKKILEEHVQDKGCSSVRKKML